MEHLLPTDYQHYIHLSRYARWIPELKRRETWEETVARYFDFWQKRGVLKNKDRKELEASVLGMHIMPSMRVLMTAGPALDRDNVAGYNCSYLAVDSIRAFDEAMYILMCGTGVGFSVERKYIKQLPEVAEELNGCETTITVSDSKVGWATSFRQLISLLYSGNIPRWDVTKVRPAGARLKTFGGRASGPEPLEDLFRFAVGLFRGAVGRRLTTLECHDLMCKVADIVVVGGVRRSAMISLSNLTDDRMRHAKGEGWYYVGADGLFTSDNPQRRLSNNSVAYTVKPDFATFMKEVLSLYESKSGERGIYNRVAAQCAAARTGRRDDQHDFGTNPCSEIILRSKQFCNLSEVVVRGSDSLEVLCKKVEQAAILGTLQASLTNFRYLSRKWRANTEEEALLGVSLTGIMDHAILSGSKGMGQTGAWLNKMKGVAIETNKRWAKQLGIERSASITCVKPSGTVSQLVDSASGMHPRFSQYYIRRVRSDDKDPLSQVLIDSGVPYTTESNNYIFEFPMEVPKNSTCVKDVGALYQLDLWKTYQKYWCEHKPSQTIYYTDSEFLPAMSWVWDNFNDVSGISFFPHLDHVYENAPYEEIDKDEYARRIKEMPSIDWAQLKEEDDNTEGVQTLACSAGGCEI